MIEAYLAGSIRQSIERIRQLRGIVQSQHPREYDGLRQLCLTKLDQALAGLNGLISERIVDPTLQTPRRVRAFKRLVEQLNNVEGIGIFALNRRSAEDELLNHLITDICNEISYPLITPVISHMSQDYFHIYSEFNLLCLPLIESRFLLHLPDVYHELCHPLHRNLDLHVLQSYDAAFKDSLFGMVRHYQSEILAAERLRNQEARLFQLQLWRTCWAKYWMEEFFCDLFGVLTAGPAYAWSHYHLSVKRGGDPYETPLTFETTHPADDARMRAVLEMLRSSGAFKNQADAIAAAWREFVGIMGYRAPAEYVQCYSDGQIASIVAAVRQGVEGIGVQLAGGTGNGKIRILLDDAWKEFWQSPTTYQEWENQHVANLRASVSA